MSARSLLQTTALLTSLLPLAASAAPPHFSPVPKIISPEGGDTDLHRTDWLPHVATDGLATWVVVWEHEFDIYATRSVNGGRDWSSPRQVNKGSSLSDDTDTLPRVATDGKGNWVTAWYSEDARLFSGGDDDILFARSTDGKFWTSTQLLNSNATADSGDDTSPDLAVDSAGNWVAVWDSTDTLGGTIGSDWDVLFARSTDAGITWTAPQPLNTNAATDSGRDGGVRLTHDGAGQWIATWTSDDDLGGSIGNDDDLLISRSTDAGATWSAPQALNTTAASDGVDEGDGGATLSTDGAGNWVAMWSWIDLVAPIDYDLLVARSSDAGATWTAPARVEPTLVGDTDWEIGAQLATDGQGVWIALWAVSGFPSPFVPEIMQSVSTDAGATWSAPTIFSSGSGGDRTPHLASNGRAGWVAAWAGGLEGESFSFDILMRRSPPSVPSLGPRAAALAAGVLLVLGVATATQRRRHSPGPSHSPAGCVSDSSSTKRSSAKPTSPVFGSSKTTVTEARSTRAKMPV